MCPSMEKQGHGWTLTNIDEPVKSQMSSSSVIPAKAGHEVKHRAHPVFSIGSGLPPRESRILIFYGSINESVDLLGFQAKVCL